MGQIYTERKEAGNDKLPILTVSIHTGVSDGALDETELGKRVKRSEDKSTYKIARKNDLVFNMMRAWQGAIGTVRTTGMVSPAYIVAYPNDLVEPIFMDYLVKCKQMIDSIHRLSYGVTDFRLRLYWDSFVEIPINVPSLEEQKKIASFLTLLDKRIAKQRELVEHLKSYKRGVLSAIFSRKIRFRDKDGNPFPEWIKCTIGQVFSERCERAIGNEDLLAVTINSGIIKRDEIELKDNSSEDKSNYKRVCVDDIAYNTMRMWQGASGVSAYHGIVSPAYTVIYAAEPHKTDIRFWGYYFKTYRLICEFQRYSQGLTSDTWNLKYPQLADIEVYRPCLDEQKRIADFLENLETKMLESEQFLEKLSVHRTELLRSMFI